MDSEKVVSIIAIIFLIGLISLMLCSVGAGWTERAWRNAVIENGGGYWTIDAKTGDKKFVWKVFPKDENLKEKK